MRKSKNSIFYTGIIGGFSVLMYLIVSQGEKLEKGRNIALVRSGEAPGADLIHSVKTAFQQPLVLLLLQIVTIIAVARIFGWICRKIRQPAVIGEMIAGIALGPSLVGMYLPEFSAALFPPHSLSHLQMLSQVGMILFMFIVGMELDLNVLRIKRGRRWSSVMPALQSLLPWGWAWLFLCTGGLRPTAFSSFHSRCLPVSR